MRSHVAAREVVEEAIRYALRIRPRIAESYVWTRATPQERLRMADTAILETVRRLQMVAASQKLDDEASIQSFQRYAERSMDRLAEAESPFSNSDERS